MLRFGKRSNDSKRTQLNHQPKTCYMKRYFLPVLFTFLFFTGTVFCWSQENKAEYQIIPKPLSIEAFKGKFYINSKTKIFSDAGLLNEKMYLTTLFEHITKANPAFDSQKSGSIQLIIDKNIKEDEGYILSVTTDKILIAGKNPSGVFYGIQTLRQLLPASIESELSQLEIPAVQAVKIVDSPRFPYRGMHLDVGRHIFPVASIKKYIDLIAMHKMNTLHWHLTEDQGWRIEIKRYPKLTEIGSKRYGTITGKLHQETGNDETPYEGFYTQEEVKDIVKYAAQRHIVVIPELELPGHASAAIASYPFLSCFPEEPTIITNEKGSKGGKKAQNQGHPKLVQETWGVFDDVFCAGNEKTFKFLENVLEEILPLFPSQYIHIGGDECPKNNWKRCSSCQKRIAENKLADEHELQSYFIQRIEKYLNAKGRKIIGWDEILEGGLAPNAAVMSWRGEKGGIEAAKQHHKVIMTPGPYCYFDKYQVDKEKQAQEPLAIGGYIPVEKVYQYEPVPAELNSEEEQYILGAQGNLWTEYIQTANQVEYMVLPRMSALSEVVWSAKGNKNWDNFKIRLNALKKRYDVLGLHYAGHVFENSSETKK